MTRTWMSCWIVSTVVLLGCTPASPEMQIINDAVEAVGGRRVVEDVKTVVIEGEGENFRLGQNQHPDRDLPIYAISNFTREIDYEHSRWRQEQSRTSTFLTGNPAVNQRQITAVDGDVAFNVSENGDATRASSLVAKDRRIELYHYPVGILQAAMAEASIVSNARQEDGYDVVDITTAEGDQLTLFVESESGFPAKVSSMSYNRYLGDVTIETEFDDYWQTDALGGLGLGGRPTLPRQLLWRLDEYVTAELRVTTSVNSEISDLAAPDEARSADEPVPTANVTVEELASGIWFLAGQSHHSVLVEFADYLALIEAPQDDTRTLAVIAKARELEPDKPLRYVINTHHHFDHSGGIRAAVSEGLTVITHAVNKPFFEDIVARQHTIVEDALAKNPQPLAIETIPYEGNYVLDDGRRTMEIYPILDNRHSRTLLMVYLPRERLLVEADVYSPAASEAPFAANLLENIEDRGLRVDRVVPIHGGVVPFEDFQQAATRVNPSE